MKVLRVLLDNSTALTGLLTALFGLLTAFGLDLSKDQIAAVMTFAGAVVVVLALVVTTAKRTVVARVTGDGDVIAGQAAVAATGTKALLTETKGGDPVPLLAVKPELVTADVTIENQEKPA